MSKSTPTSSAATRSESIRQTRVISAPPEQVYDAFVNARKHAAFTGAEATGQARVGAAFTAWGGYISGKHLELEKGKRIVQEWSTTEWPEAAPPSRLEFRFEPHETGCRVTMIQTRIPAGEAARYKQGWIDFYWEPLARYFQAKGKR